ncbi:MAG TPA: V-type ATPase subunit, partial [Defluviitaleaceae bacterium]|nr:V-type ATPase subunit [Defluviitaleaceae bacterium]
MGSISNFAAISTKIKAKKSKLLNEEDYRVLLSKKNVSEIVEYLKKDTGYRKVFKDINPLVAHRGQIELELYKNIVKQIEDLLPYLKGNYKKYFIATLYEYEIEDLKLILRTISRNEDTSQLKDLLIHSKKYSSLDYENLLNSKSIEEFFEKLKGTVFYIPIKNTDNEDILKREFHIEMQIEILFYKTLMERAVGLSREDEEIIKKSLGTIIDLNNIQWIYRGMKYYNILPEEILIYCIPGGYRLNYNKLKNLVYSQTVENFISKIKTSKYAFVFPNDEDVYIERRINRYIYK